MQQQLHTLAEHAVRYACPRGRRPIGFASFPVARHLYDQYCETIYVPPSSLSSMLHLAERMKDAAAYVGLDVTSAPTLKSRQDGARIGVVMLSFESLNLTYYVGTPDQLVRFWVAVLNGNGQRGDPFQNDPRLGRPCCGEYVMRLSEMSADVTALVASGHPVHRECKTSGSDYLDSITRVTGGHVRFPGTRTMLPKVVNMAAVREVPNYAELVAFVALWVQYPNIVPEASGQYDGFVCEMSKFAAFTRGERDDEGEMFMGTFDPLYKIGGGSGSTIEAVNKAIDDRRNDAYEAILLAIVAARAYASKGMQVSTRTETVLKVVLTHLFLVLSEYGPALKRLDTDAIIAVIVPPEMDFVAAPVHEENVNAIAIDIQARLHDSDLARTVLGMPSSMEEAMSSPGGLRYAIVEGVSPIQLLYGIPSLTNSGAGAWAVATMPYPDKNGRMRTLVIASSEGREFLGLLRHIHAALVAPKGHLVNRSKLVRMWWRTLCHPRAPPGAVRTLMGPAICGTMGEPQENASMASSGADDFLLGLRAILAYMHAMLLVKPPRPPEWSVCVRVAARIWRTIWTGGTFLDESGNGLILMISGVLGDVARNSMPSKSQSRAAKKRKSEASDMGLGCLFEFATDDEKGAPPLHVVELPAAAPSRQLADFLGISGGTYSSLWEMCQPRDVRSSLGLLATALFDITSAPSSVEASLHMDDTSITVPLDRPLRPGPGENKLWHGSAFLKMTAQIFPVGTKLTSLLQDKV